MCVAEIDSNPAELLTSRSSRHTSTTSSPYSLPILPAVPRQPRLGIIHERKFRLVSLHPSGSCELMSQKLAFLK
jgi:hypothetical protein